MADYFREYADYGFENNRYKKKGIATPYADPTGEHEVEYITEMLAKQRLGIKEAIPNFYFGELQWGTQPGAIKLSFGPFGGLRAVIKKLEHDLEGNGIWVCKRVIKVQDKFVENPDNLIEKLSEDLVEVDHKGFDSPNNTYENLERLTLKLASYLRKNTKQQIFIYEGIRKLVENQNYIIHWGVSGMGRQRQGQKRLDQFAVQLIYEKDLGYIKIAGTELGDVIGKHRWKYDPSQFLEIFMPNQKEEEILEAILGHFDSY